MSSIVEERLQQILDEIRALRKEQMSPSGVKWNTLLALPSHLQKTLIMLSKLGISTATDVAQLTQNVRAVESLYLNQLTLLGIVMKERKGRMVYFRVKRVGGGEQRSGSV